MTDPVNEIIKTVGQSGTHLDRIKFSEGAVSRLFPKDLGTLDMVSNLTTRQVEGIARIKAVKALALPHATYLDEICEAVERLNVSKKRGGRNDLVEILQGILNYKEEEPGIVQKITGK